MPLARKQPKLWPAEPVNLNVIVSSGRPAKPYFLATSPLSVVPTVRLVFLIGSSAMTFSPRSIAGLASGNQLRVIERFCRP